MAKRKVGIPRPDRNLRVEVRRDYDGRCYSQVVDRALGMTHPYVIENHVSWCVVIDRQKGRGMDADTVISRAQGVAEVMGIPYDEDLTWPCGAVAGQEYCHCPRCAGIADRRARK